MGLGFRKGLFAGILLPVGTVVLSIAYSIPQELTAIGLGRLALDGLTVAFHILALSVPSGALLGVFLGAAFGILLFVGFSLVSMPVLQRASLLVALSFALVAAIFVVTVINCVLSFFSLGGPDLFNPISVPGAPLAFYMTFTSRKSVEAYLVELSWQIGKR